MIAQTEQVQHSIAPATLLLALDKEVAAKVLWWATGNYGSGIGYLPCEIKKVLIQGAYLRFELSGGRATHIHSETFADHWVSLQAYEAQMIAQDVEAITQTEPQPTVTTTTVEVYSDSDTELDVIELEIGGYIETRLGYVEENWAGELFHHIFFEPYDNEELWLSVYRKSSERGSARVEDDDVEYISQLEKALTYHDLAG